MDTPACTEIPLFSFEELVAVTQKVGNRKALGPDGIRIGVIKIIARECPFLLLNI